MNRVCVLVEGDTEASFVDSILRPEFERAAKAVLLYPVLFRKQGGSFNYEKCQKVILRALKQDRSVHITTMVDFYGMPKDWPGRDQANQCHNYIEKANVIEDSILKNITESLGRSFNPHRLIPYVQMHEFEALLFSSPVQLAEGLGDKELSSAFQTIRNKFPTPEEINDRYEKCPSRRIISIFQGFKKTINGITAARRIGLDTMWRECPHFNEWVTKLENLGNR
ncbi:MAG: hypothetical protein A2Z25_08035 [Planctomycetes bacterium RBG_16_55_9]|nr:MAG: hypothetical protein A2Z25_08035 [Planctomycetes bacterium RBG_16_55_9]